MSMKSSLESATNVALVVTCGVFIWFMVANRIRHETSPTLGMESALKGKFIPSLSDYQWSANPETLVLGVRDGCHFCQASMPFYRLLSEAERAGKLHAHLLAVMPDPPEVGVLDMHSGGVDVRGVFNHPLSELHVDVTPTLLLVDSQGKIERAWVGQLSDSQQKTVLNALEK
jgi:hypothetical protein